MRVVSEAKCEQHVTFHVQSETEKLQSGSGKGQVKVLVSIENDRLSFSLNRHHHYLNIVCS